MATPKARIEGPIIPGARVYLGKVRGVLTTCPLNACPEYLDPIGVIEGALMRLTPEGEKILAAGQ